MSNFIKATEAKELAENAPDTNRAFEEKYPVLSNNISMNIRNTAGYGKDSTTIVLHDVDVDLLELDDLNDLLRENGYTTWFSLWLAHDSGEEDEGLVIETDKFDDDVLAQMRGYSYFTANVVVSWD